jgi:hypothetical protein
LTDSKRARMTAGPRKPPFTPRWLQRPERASAVLGFPPKRPFADRNSEDTRMTGKADFETFAHEAEYRSGSDGHLGLLSRQFRGGGFACSCSGDKCPISNRISAGFSHNHCRRYSPIRSLTEAPMCKRCMRITRLHQAHHPWVSSPQTFYIPLSAVPRFAAIRGQRLSQAYRQRLRRLRVSRR